MANKFNDEGVTSGFPQSTGEPYVMPETRELTKADHMTLANETPLFIQYRSYNTCHY